MTDGTMGRPSARAIEVAAREFRRALAEGDSAFTPGRAIWTSANARELRERFNGQPDVSGASFDEKLQAQIGTAGPGPVQLFAELYCLDLLPLSDYKPMTKRTLITSTLALADTGATIPAVVDAALGGGVLNGGVAFKTRRYQQLCYLIEFADGMLAMDSAKRLNVLAGPKQFRDALDGVTSTNSPSQRYALLYLFFPDFFLPIVKTEHRAQIRSAFADRIARPTGDPDEDLRSIYDLLSSEAGGAAELYDAPYREAWDPKALSSSTYQQQRRIADDDFKIGPSYFMREAVYGPGGLERVWETSILPLLEEHSYGEQSRAQVSAKYGYPTIAAAVDLGASVAEPDAGTEDVPGDPATA